MTLKFSSFWHVDFWKMMIFHLHGQYAYQMKAEIILNSYLESKSTIMYKFFWKICDRNFFSFENWKKKFFEIQFFQKISYIIVLFDSKYEFRMISAFIWYAYCPCRWKIIIFQKFASQKLENFSVKLGHFGVNLRKNYSSYKVAQSFYRCAKIPSFIWDHV